MKHPFPPLMELADVTRLRVFLAILGPRKNVSQIVSELGLAQPQVSYHLRKLKRAGLAVEEKDGRWVWYQAHWQSGDRNVRDFLDLMSRWAEESGLPAGGPRPGADSGGDLRVEVVKRKGTGAGIMSGGGRRRRAVRVPARGKGAARREDGEGRPVIERPESDDSDLDDFML